LSLTDLKTALEQIDARIVEITASPFPDVSIGGKSVQKTAYLRTLMDEREKLQQIITGLEPTEEILVGWS
jgi:hypothetical protein